MAKAVAGYTPSQVQGGPLDPAAVAADFVQGQFVGFSASGTLVLANGGAVKAVGALLQGAVRKDPKGNALATATYLTYVMGAAKIAGMTDSGGAALTPGAMYYVVSGGHVASAGTQVVGVAMSASELQLMINLP